jgi:protoporphyrinogen/coproporphyrinogen III oxidase
MFSPRLRGRSSAMTDGVARVVVVGGGITGLAAAHAAVEHARERGHKISVTVMERSPRFGGNLVTERVGGFLLDGGPDSWVASKPQASALARGLGLGGELVGTNEATRRFYVAWRGGLHVVPDGLVLGVPTRIGPLARTRLFSWRGKVRMAMEPFVRARRKGEADDESIADFAARRLGREAAERLMAPLLGGISAGDASDLSVRAAFPQLVAMEHEYGSLVRGLIALRREREQLGDRGTGTGPDGSAFVSLAGGMAALVDALAAWLRGAGVTLRTGTGVRALARGARGWTLELGDGDRVAADALLLAIPGYAAAGVLRTLDEEASRRLSLLSSASTATVFLGYRRSEVAHPLDATGFVVPRMMQRPILAGTWVSSKWHARAPEGHVLIRAFFGGASGEGALQGDDSDLVRLARAELKALMGLTGEPVLARVFRFDRASPQMRVGHIGTMRAIRDRLGAVAPRVGIAGGGYDGIGIPDCIRQGQESSRALVDAIGAAAVAP